MIPSAPTKNIKSINQLFSNLHEATVAPTIKKNDQSHNNKLHKSKGYSVPSSTVVKAGNAQLIDTTSNKTTNRRTEASAIIEKKKEDGDIKENTSTETFSNQKGFKILHLNARSLLPKLDSVKHNFTPHTNIMCFTETWFKPELMLELTQIQNYNLNRNDRKNKRGGGTCIFLREEIKYEIISQVSDNDIEMQSVIVNGHNAKKIILLNCYRPPSGKPENAVDAIKNCLYQISNLERCEIVILGDLNLDYSDVNSDSYKLLNSIEDEFNLKQIIQKTRIHRNGQEYIEMDKNTSKW